MKITSLKDLEKIKEAGFKSLYPDKPKITVGMATCGFAAGCGLATVNVKTTDA